MSLFEFKLPEPELVSKPMPQRPADLGAEAKMIENIGGLGIKMWGAKKGIELGEDLEVLEPEHRQEVNSILNQFQNKLISIEEARNQQTVSSIKYKTQRNKIIKEYVSSYPGFSSEFQSVIARTSPTGSAESLSEEGKMGGLLTQVLDQAEEEENRQYELALDWIKNVGGEVPIDMPKREVINNTTNAANIVSSVIQKTSTYQGIFKTGGLSPTKQRYYARALGDSLSLTLKEEFMEAVKEKFPDWEGTSLKEIPLSDRKDLLGLFEQFYSATISRNTMGATLKLGEIKEEMENTALGAVYNSIKSILTTDIAKEKEKWNLSIIDDIANTEDQESAMKFINHILNFGGKADSASLTSLIKSGEYKEVAQLILQSNPERYEQLLAMKKLGEDSGKHITEVTNLITGITPELDEALDNEFLAKKHLERVNNTLALANIDDKAPDPATVTKLLDMIPEPLKKELTNRYPKLVETYEQEGTKLIQEVSYKIHKNLISLFDVNTMDYTPPTPENNYTAKVGWRAEGEESENFKLLQKAIKFQNELNHHFSNLVEDEGQRETFFSPFVKIGRAVESDLEPKPSYLETGKEDPSALVSKEREFKEDKGTASGKPVKPEKGGIVGDIIEDVGEGLKGFKGSLGELLDKASLSTSTHIRDIHNFLVKEAEAGGLPLLEQLKVDEGTKRDDEGNLVAYLEKAGKKPVWTIGYGHTKGVKEGDTITQEEAEKLLVEDMIVARTEVYKLFPEEFKKMSGEQKDALTNMMFNLGWNKFNEFKKMIEAIRAGDWNKASKEALDSDWARQVKGRAKRIVDQFKK